MQYKISFSLWLETRIWTQANFGTEHSPLFRIISHASRRLYFESFRSPTVVSLPQLKDGKVQYSPISDESAVQRLWILSKLRFTSPHDDFSQILSRASRITSLSTANSTRSPRIRSGQRIKKFHRVSVSSSIS